MTAILLAIGGTLLLAIFVIDWKVTGGRNVAEFLKVNPGIFQKGSAKARNGMILLGLVGPTIGVLLLLGVDEEKAIMWSFLGTLAIGFMVGVAMMAWLVVSGTIEWLRRR